MNVSQPGAPHTALTGVTYNSSALSKLVQDVVSDVVEVLNEGASANPDLAVVIAIATPVVLFALCMAALTYRAAYLAARPCCACCACCMLCSNWRKVKQPKGLEPDVAVDEHEDEHDEHDDSADEESRADAPAEDVEDNEDAEDATKLPEPTKGQNGQRACCSKMAEALEKVQANA